MKPFRNEFVTITVEPHLHLLRQTWVGVPTSEAYQEGWRLSGQLHQDHQIKRWLIDQQQLRLFNPVDLQWLIQVGLSQSRGRQTANVQVAIVLTDLNQFCKLGSDLTLRAAFAQNQTLQSRYFTEVEAAHNWLTVKRTTQFGGKSGLCSTSR